MTGFRKLVRIQSISFGFVLVTVPSYLFRIFPALERLSESTENLSLRYLPGKLPATEVAGVTE